MLIAGTLYLKILSGAQKKLLDKVSVSGKYLFQGLHCCINMMKFMPYSLLTLLIGRKFLASTKIG